MRLCFYTLSLALFFALVRCGGETGPSGQITASVTPSSPLVVTSDLTIPISATEKYVVAAPYITIYMSVSNGSTETVNVSGFRYEVEYRSTDKSGRSSTVTAGPSEIGPSSYVSLYGTRVIKSSPTCIGSASYGQTGYCDQNILAKLEPGQTITFTTTTTDASADDRPLKMYISGLPESDGTNYAYRFKVTLLGYFGTADNVTNRLNKSFYFTTQ